MLQPKQRQPAAGGSPCWQCRTCCSWSGPWQQTHPAAAPAIRTGGVTTGNAHFAATVAIWHAGTCDTRQSSTMLATACTEALELCCPAQSPGSLNDADRLWMHLQQGCGGGQGVQQCSEQSASRPPPCTDKLYAFTPILILSLCVPTLMLAHPLYQCMHSTLLVCRLAMRAHAAGITT